MVTCTRNIQALLCYYLSRFYLPGKCYSYWTKVWHSTWSIVHANIVDSYKSAILGDLEDSQTVQGKFTPLNFTVFSSNPSETIILRAGQLQLINTESLPAFIYISLQPCPWGFTPTNYPSECGCAPLLREKHM